MKRIVVPILIVLCTLATLACTNPATSASSSSSSSVDTAQVDKDFSSIVKALNAGDSDAALSAIANCDSKYGTKLSAALAPNITATSTKSKLSLSTKLASSDSSGYPELTDLPFDVNGAVYLSGGAASAISYTISWLCPKTYPGHYYHGALLDLSKFDANNLSSSCMETAVTKGAGWESADDWMTEKVNVCVLKPNFSVNQTKLTQAENDIAYYCNLPSSQEEYGFFKDYVDIFDLVTTSDNYTWYCTKVVWRIWNDYGIDINAHPSLNFTSSGLYTLVKAYYDVVYWYSSSKSNKAVQNYITNAASTFVLAEDILESSHFSKEYEKIRDNS